MNELYPFNKLHLVRFYIPEGHFSQNDMCPRGPETCRTISLEHFDRVHLVKGTFCRGPISKGHCKGHFARGYLMMVPFRLFLLKSICIGS